MGFGTVNVGQAQAENNNYLTNEQVGVAGGLATLGGDGKLTEVPAACHRRLHQGADRREDR